MTDQEVLSQVVKDVENYQFLSARARLDYIVEALNKEEMKIIQNVLMKLQAFYLDVTPINKRDHVGFFVDDNEFRNLPDDLRAKIVKENGRLVNTYIGKENRVFMAYALMSYAVYNMDGMRASIWMYRVINELKKMGDEFDSVVHDIQGSCRYVLKEISDVTLRKVEKQNREFILYNDYSLIEQYIRKKFSDNFSKFITNKNFKFDYFLLKGV